MFAWQFAIALHKADQNNWSRFVSMQNHYNLVYREEEREMIPFCLNQGIGLIPWSPLARGFLAGNRSKKDWGETSRAKTDDYAQKLYYKDSDFAIVENLHKVAEAHPDTSPMQIALAWILHKKGIAAPIIGASKMKHLEEAVRAVDIELSEEEIALLEAPYVPHEILGHH